MGASIREQVIGAIFEHPVHRGGMHEARDLGDAALAVVRDAVLAVLEPMSQAMPFDDHDVNAGYQSGIDVAIERIAELLGGR